MDKLRDLDIIDVMPKGYYQCDLTGTFTHVNEELCKLLERTPADLVGLNFQDYMKPDKAGKIYETYHSVFETELPQQIEYDFTRLDGTPMTLEISVYPLKDGQGKKIGFHGMVEETTGRKQLEENLRQSMRRFESLFENANEMIITTDKLGYITRLNKKVEEISGYTKEELIGKSILTIAHPDDRDIYIQFWHELVSGLSPRHELKAIGKEGKRVEYLLASGSAIHEGGEIIEIQYNAQIITDLKQAQETILDLKNHLKSIIESSPDMIICLDSRGLVELINPVTERVLHIPMSAMLGRKLTEVCPELAVFENDIESTIHERLPRTLMEETLPDGNVYNITIYPLAAGVPGGGVVFAAVDITEKKRMEVELIQAQKMETIGLLAGGFAHDFNNILMGITGNLSLLKMSSDEAKRAKYIASMESISGRAKDLISQMLMFSKKTVGSPQRFSVNKIMQDVIDMATKSISKNVSIELIKPEKDHDLFMDYTQLTQVMLNLIINARDAIGNRQDGLIKISVQPIHVDEALKRRYMLERTGRYIKIDIMDNGCGIEKQNLTKIFDPFFTTKPKDVGTGLGLAITYNIIKHAEGSIQVTSEKDKGTRFSIILPITDGVIEAEPEYAEIKTTGQRFRILLVDDEEMLREIGKEMLESLGHEVLTARNGFECIEMLKKEDGSIDLVILDMIMPGLDGQHTLMEMVKAEIQTKVMVSSGFYHEELSDNVMANSLVVAKLNKPFNMQELSRVLATIF